MDGTSKQNGAMAFGRGPTMAISLELREQIKVVTDLLTHEDVKEKMINKEGVGEGESARAMEKERERRKKMLEKLRKQDGKRRAKEKE